MPGVGGPVRVRYSKTICKDTLFVILQLVPDFYHDAYYNLAGKDLCEAGLSANLKLHTLIRS